MAERNTGDGRRFIFRSPTKEPEAFFVPINRTGTSLSSKISPTPPPTIIRSANAITPRTDEANPARRVVVIRNSNHPQVDQGPVDLGSLGRPNSVISDGRKQLFLIRRPIEPPKPVESEPPAEEPSSTIVSEHIRTPTPPIETVISPDPPPPPSPPGSPPTRPKSSKSVQSYVPYLRRPKSKTRTPSPVHIIAPHSSPPPYHKRPPRPKYHLPPPSKQEKPKDTDPEANFCTFFWIDNTTESVNSPPLATIENEQSTVEHHRTSTLKSAQRKKSASTRPKSAKPVVLVNPADQSIVVIEDSHAKGESLRPILKSATPSKKTRFEDDINDKSTEELVKTSRWQTCLSCLSRHICLIIILCSILVLIGLAGVGVSAYFLAQSKTTYPIPKSIGVAVGGVLAIAALCFLYILLGCIGARDGYFTYNDNEPRAGGRAYAIIPPSHSNARLYIPRDYMKMIENHHPPSMTHISTSPTSNVMYRQSSFMTPVSTIPYTQQQTISRSKTSANGFENKSNKNNIIIEMPDHLVAGRQTSPRSRERSLNKIVRNVTHVVEDAKKRYHGDVPNKVIVKVDNTN